MARALLLLPMASTAPGFHASAHPLESPKMLAELRLALLRVLTVVGVLSLARLWFAAAVAVELRPRRQGMDLRSICSRIGGERSWSEALEAENLE